jgi:hypothetical protein
MAILPTVKDEGWREISQFMSSLFSPYESPPAGKPHLGKRNFSGYPSIYMCM